MLRKLKIFLLLIFFASPVWASVGQVDFVLVEKGERRLTLLSQGKPVKSYRVALGREPLGDKFREGDGRTPEGRYTIDWRNPQSKFHLSLHISYPRPDQIEDAKRRGVSPGGAIMIHGLPSDPTKKPIFRQGHPRVDWTEGCIAVTDEEIEEIWSLVPDGTPIEIKP